MLKQYSIDVGSQITFGDGMYDVLFTPKNTATANGRVSALWDRGTGAKPMRYRYYSFAQSASTYTANRAVRQYVAQGNGTYIPGSFSTSDQAISSETLLAGWTPLKPIIAHVTTAATVLVAEGELILRARYVQFGWWNDLGVTLTNTTNYHGILLQAIADVIEETSGEF